MRVLTALVAAVLGLGPALSADIYRAEPIEAEWFFPYPDHPLHAAVYVSDDHDDIGPVNISIDGHIRIEGPIEEGDYERFAELLQIDNNVAVTLNSPGGAFQEALKIADAIYSSGVTTVVLPGDTCLSACALIFMAGNSVLLRSVTQLPSRIATVGSRVGFHAPFSSLSFGNMPVDPGTMDQVAEMFYARARESIRLIQARISQWQMSPDFVFELLGRGPEEFLQIDRAAAFYANPMYLGAPAAAAPTSMTAVEAFRACELMLYLRLSDGTPQSHNRVVSVLDELGLRRFSIDMSKSLIGTAESFVDGDIRAPHFYPGRGPLHCNFTRDTEGQWHVTAGGDLPLLDRQIQRLKLSNYLLLGLFVPWQEDDRAAELDAIEANAEEVAVPEGLASVDSPSFACSGDLDAAERMICGEARLGRLDGIMGALYARYRDRPGVRMRQRAWLKAREAGCLAGEAAGVDAARRRDIVHCMVLMTAAQVADLAMIGRSD